MDDVLNEFEVRVLGALVEKQITTPDYYPLSLNAIINACNQKSSRDPVVSYDEQTVMRALDDLREKNLVYVFHGAEARVPKYGHIFPKSFDLNPQEVAVMCVLMLRGPQTAGEIRQRATPLHNFDSLAEVETTLQGLISREPQPLVARLPRQAGMKESRCAHLLSGPVEVEMSEVAPRAESAATRTRSENERLARLEEDVRTLREEVAALRQQLLDFRRQFE